MLNTHPPPPALYHNLITYYISYQNQIVFIFINVAIIEEYSFHGSAGQFFSLFLIRSNCNQTIAHYKNANLTISSLLCVQHCIYFYYISSKFVPIHLMFVVKTKLNDSGGNDSHSFTFSRISVTSLQVFSSVQGSNIHQCKLTDWQFCNNSILLFINFVS